MLTIFNVLFRSAKCIHMAVKGHTILYCPYFMKTSRDLLFLNFFGDIR